MRTRQVETFSLRKLQQPSPGLATLLPPTQDSGHLPRRTVHRTISRNFTVHRREIGRLVIKDHDHDQPAIVVFASVSKFHIFLYLTACVKAPGPSPSPSIGKFRPIDSSTASPGHSRDFRVSFIDTVTTLHCCCRCWQRFYNYLKYLMAPLPACGLLWPESFSFHAKLLLKVVVDSCHHNYLSCWSCPP